MGTLGAVGCQEHGGHRNTRNTGMPGIWEARGCWEHRGHQAHRLHHVGDQQLWSPPSPAYFPLVTSLSLLESSGRATKLPPTALPKLQNSYP